MSNTIAHEIHIGTNIKPFLKWAGNKYSCLNLILENFPAANRLIEPFAGSAAVFNNTNYSSYLLADENQDLVSLFQYLQREKESFIHECKVLFCEKNNCSTRYYELREQFNACTDPRERAILFLYLNRHGYNGLCRYNSQGIYNVPFGSYVKPYFPDAEMRFFCNKSEQATFIQGDFQKTFTYAQEGDLVYCDPPYAPLVQRSNFSAYTHKKFGEKEQILLADLARQYAQRGITVIISNHDTAFTREQYHTAEIKSLLVNRKISCNAKNRTPAKELLAIFHPMVDLSFKKNAATITNKRDAGNTDNAN